MSKLIALVDASIYAHSVCDHVAWIAGRTGASVDLLHVLGRREAANTGDLSGSIALGARTALLKELSDLDEKMGRLSQQRGRAVLDDAAAMLRDAGVRDVTPHLRNGDLVEAVADYEADADLVVVGKRGEAADFASQHLGSNLERIVRGSKKPVFVTSRAFKPVEKVLIAYDGGASSLKAVDHVARSPLFAGLTCRLLMIGGDTPENQRRLADARAILKGGGIEVEAALVPGQPDRVISHMVEEEGYDMLVMGAYGHSRIRNLIIGSTTTAMVRLCKVPVLLFR